MSDEVAIFVGQTNNVVGHNFLTKVVCKSSVAK